MNETASSQNCTFRENSSNPNHHIIYAVLSIVIGILYIYHNPANWKALSINYPAFFLALKPHTYSAHIPEFICIILLWLMGYVLGFVFLKILLKQKISQNISVIVAIGWGVLAFILFGLAIAQCFNAYAIGSVLGFTFLFCFPLAWKMGAFQKRSIFRQDWLASLTWDSRLALILLAIPFALAFYGSLMPPTQSDGLRYHLSVPRMYLQYGGLYRIPDIAFSNFPFLIEYLYAIPLAFGLISVPKMIHASFYIMTIRLIYDLGKRMGKESCDGKRIGVYAALLFASTPFTSIFASWSFIEMGLTFYTLLAFSFCLEALEWGKEGKRDAVRMVILAGAAGGFLLSCKYTALTSILLLSIILAWPREEYTFKNAAAHFRLAFLFLLAAGLTASPWYIKNMILLGNPVYPFARGLFPTPFWTDFNDLFFRFHAGTKGRFNELMNAPLFYWLQDAITLPFRVIFFPGDRKLANPEDFGSWQLGPIWLTLAPFILLHRAWNWRKVLHGIACLFLYLVWAYTYRDSRFLLPAMAVSAPLLAALMADLISIRGWTKILFLIQVCYCLLFTASVSLLPTVNAPWWVVSGTITKDVYLESVCDYTRNTNRAFRWLRENTKPDEKVLLHGIEHPFYCPNPFIGADWFNTDPLIAWSWENPDAEKLLQKVRREGVRYLVYYYGKIKTPGYFHFYRFFRFPPERGYELLKEYKEKEYTRLEYPLAYQEWANRFYQKMQSEEENAPNIRALIQLLDGGMLKEVYRYVNERFDAKGRKILPDGVEDGIVIYHVPDRRSE